MQLKRVGEPTVSPDSKWVAFSAVDVSLDANTKTPHLWIIPVAGGSNIPRSAPPAARTLAAYIRATHFASSITAATFPLWTARASAAWSDSFWSA